MYVIGLMYIVYGAKRRFRSMEKKGELILVFQRPFNRSVTLGQVSNLVFYPPSQLVRLEQGGPRDLSLIHI